MSLVQRKYSTDIVIFLSFFFCMKAKMVNAQEEYQVDYRGTIAV